MNLSILPLAFVALITLPRMQETDGTPVLSLADIVLDQYAVKNVDAEELFALADSLAGRQYYLKERGGVDTSPVDSLRMLGDSIVLYDTKAEVARVKELLARLDVVREVGTSAFQASEYRPRFLALDTVARAIGSRVDSYDVLEERGLLVLKGQHADVEEALAFLKRIDVPEKQVLLTCQLVEVGGAQQGPALAKDLLDNLQRLLPQTQFSQAGMAMLKTSVGSSEQISLQIDTAVLSYSLSFTPVAFDEGSGSLTITDCSLVEQNPGYRRELFRTGTVLRGGEYTVLAATGATPKLLVVRVVPQ
ncbi:MAG: hypothetical protein EXS08_16255 [Planctomycetes bacterium]|nr:hypothetical protein [Planctomycetota bacterium]